MRSQPESSPLEKRLELVFGFASSSTSYLTLVHPRLFYSNYYSHPLLHHQSSTTRTSLNSPQHSSAFETPRPSHSLRTAPSRRQLLKIRVDINLKGQYSRLIFFPLHQLTHCFYYRHLSLCSWTQHETRPCVTLQLSHPLGSLFIAGQNTIQTSTVGTTI